MCEWINVKDRLPEIPDGKHGVTVIVALYAKGLNETNNRNSAGIIKP
jgi:hypothetical protein